MEFFRARYDRLAAGLTAVVLAVFAGGLVLVLTQPVPSRELRLGLALLILLVPLVTYLYSPTGFSVGPEGVRIHKPGGTVLLPLGSLRAARRAAPGELCGLRTFGSGGLFGYFGWFWTRSLGHYRAYITSRHHMVLVQAERAYLLSPERPEDFLARLREWRPDLATPVHR